MNLIAKATTALTLGAATLTMAAPAEAQRWRGDRYDRYHHRDRTGPAIAAGVAGLAIGAALASSSRRDRYYDRGYYGDDYYYDRPRYRSRSYYYDRPRYRGYREYCSTRRVWDPYEGRRVRVRYCR